MNLLAMDTTTDVCSVALAADGCVVEHTRSAPRLHNEHLLAMVDAVTKSAAIDKTAVDVIAFGAGPASFTGVRYGAAVAQGLAFAVGAFVLPVPSSEVAAETVRLATGRTGVWRIARPSRRGWCYVARYAFLEDAVRCLDFDELAPAESLGDDVLRAAEFGASAGVVARIASGRTRQAVPAAQAQPYYVEGDTPWRTTAAATAKPQKPQR